MKTNIYLLSFILLSNCLNVTYIDADDTVPPLTTPTGPGQTGTTTPCPYSHPLPSSTPAVITYEMTDVCRWKRIQKIKETYKGIWLDWSCKAAKQPITTLPIDEMIVEWYWAGIPGEIVTRRKIDPSGTYMDEVVTALNKSRLQLEVAVDKWINSERKKCSSPCEFAYDIHYPFSFEVECQDLISRPYELLEHVNHCVNADAWVDVKTWCW